MLRPLGSLTATIAGLVLIAAASGSPARAGGDEPSADGPSAAAGPVRLFQPTATANQVAARPDRAEPQRRQPAAAPESRPVDSRAAVVRRAQSALAQLGFDPGPADGKVGPSTRAAIRDFQRAHGQPATGRVTQALLREVAASLTAARRATAAKQAGGTDAAPQRAEGDTVEVVETPADADRPAAEPKRVRSARTGLVRAAEAAPGGGAPAVQDDDGSYDIADALAESWRIMASLTGAMVELVGTQVAEAAR